MNENIISNAPVTNFDGVFRFTNATDEDFVVSWNSTEYTFPKHTTCPMIIQGETLEGIQNIRKLFAKKLAMREFYKGSEYARLHGMTTQGVPPLVDEDKTLKDAIQACLEPLPIARAEVHIPSPKDDSHLEGKIEIVEKDESLVEKGKRGGSRKKESAVI